MAEATESERAVLADLVALVTHSKDYDELALDFLRVAGFSYVKFKVAPVDPDHIETDPRADGWDWRAEDLQQGALARMRHFPLTRALYRGAAPARSAGAFWADDPRRAAGYGRDLHGVKSRLYEVTADPSAVLAVVEFERSHLAPNEWVEFILDPEKVAPVEISPLLGLHPGNQVELPALELMNLTTVQGEHWGDVSSFLKFGAAKGAYVETFDEMVRTGVVPPVPVLADGVTIPDLPSAAVVLAASIRELDVPVVMLSPEWVVAAGELRWGRYGAAGVLLLDHGHEHVLLALRASGTAEAGTWSLPGGARNEGESARAAALREASQEVGLDADDVKVLFEAEADYGDWIYTTVAAELLQAFEPTVTDDENDEVRWVALDDLHELALHPDLAEALPQLLDAIDHIPSRATA
jgi:8-oxo-dGTP pyrophosphatase MutT (NUDIX family)